MPFSQATITSGPDARPQGIGESLVSWSSSAPEGTTFQLYVNRRLAWHGTERVAHVAALAQDDLIEVGAVADAEATADLSAALPAAPTNRPILTWTGGTYLEDNIRSYRIYGEATPGGGVDLATPLAEVPAYAGGIALDGFGVGGFGDGGFGASAASYAWTGPPLHPSGAWTFTVKPVDAWGNEGAGVSVTVTLSAPPRPPAYNPTSGARLGYTYNVGTGVATLAWFASPG